VQGYRYDAAGRLVEVANSAGTHTYAYGATNQRLQLAEVGTGGATTLYMWSGRSVIAEYNGAGGGMAWTKSYVYLGARLLATDAAGGVKYHHPDPLGTRLVTNTSGAVVSEQVGLPYGNTIWAESSNLNQSDSKRRFTSYDRSETTKLDYAVNRHYSPAQGRFTQVDPIGMSAVSLTDPQSLNLYAYCANDPVNHTDPDGLFSLKGFFKGLLKVATFGIWAVKPVRQAVIKVLANKWVQLAIGIVLAVLAPPAGVIIFNLTAASQATIAALTTTRYILMGLQAAGAVSSLVAGRSGDKKSSLDIFRKVPCLWKNVRITYYDSPKNRTAIGGTLPVEGRTTAADPTAFGLPYPRGRNQTKEDEVISKVEKVANLGVKSGIPS
jgi:RHS repeat-associated protein